MATKYSVVLENPGKTVTENLLKNSTDDEFAPEDNVYRDLIMAKMVAIVVLGIVSFLIGLLPVRLAKWFNWNLTGEHNSKTTNNLVISLLLCFGGGVLMYTTFIHLQPEVREEFEALKKKGEAPELEHFAEIVFCLGFFFVYLVEEIVHTLLDQKHVHDESEDSFFHRSVSLRGCKKDKKTGKNKDPCLEIIPRVNLNQNGGSKLSEIGVKSNSTQVLLDASSVINSPHSGDATAFEHSYPTTVYPPIHHHADVCFAPSQFGKYCLKTGENDNISGVPRNDNHPRKSEGKTPEEGSAPQGNGFLVHVPNSSLPAGTSLDLAYTLRGLFTVLALSFHAVFEGLAVGLESDVSNVWYLFLAIATHKFVISFCVGVDLCSTKTRNLLIMIYLGTFAFVTPLGIGMGIGLSSDPTKVDTQLSTVILQGMAAGTLIYVVFFEVLQREKANNQSGLLQLLAILVGFGVMFGFQFFTGHHHHHDHDYHLENLQASSQSFLTPSLRAEVVENNRELGNEHRYERTGHHHHHHH